jgi:hypothetical protein
MMREFVMIFPMVGIETESDYSGLLMLGLLVSGSAMREE